MDARRLYVLGAGAAHDAGLPLYVELLDPNYLHRLRDWLHDPSRVARLSPEYKERMRSAGCVLPDSPQFIERFETLLSAMLKQCVQFNQDGTDFESLLERYSQQDPQMERRLISYYKNLIRTADTLRHMSDTPDYYVRQFCPFLFVLPAGDVAAAVITFNHDLLFELSCDYLKHHGAKIPSTFSYYLESDWAIRFQNERRPDLGIRRIWNDVPFFQPRATWAPGVEPLRRWQDTQLYRPAQGALWRLDRLPLLKLHGSFNWLICRQCGILMVDEDELEETESLTLCPKCSNAMHLGIVPPRQAKEIKVLKKLWDTSRAIVAEADLVTFVGYSLPEYDTDSFELFAHHIKRTAAIHVVAKRVPSEMRRRFTRLADGRELIFMEVGFEDFIGGVLDSLGLPFR